MTNPVNAGAGIEKELAEKYGWRVGVNVHGVRVFLNEGTPVYSCVDMTVSHEQLRAALLAEAGERQNCVELLRACHKRNDTLGEALEIEAGERAKLEARVEGWKKAFGTQTPEETCSLFRAMEIVALRKMLTAEQRNMLTDRRTTLLESDLASAAERARGLEAQLERIRIDSQAAYERLARVWQRMDSGDLADCINKSCGDINNITRRLAALSRLPTPSAEPKEK